LRFIGGVRANKRGVHDMTLTVEERAKVLVEALPYIKRFHGQIVVIKVGGNALEQARDETLLDIVLLRYVGMQPVLIHGGGPEITAMSERLGLKAEFKNGLRITDDKTMEIVKMVLTGKVNADTVAAEIALALGAAKLILLTDVEGVLGVDGHVVAVLTSEDARHRIEAGEVTGGMIPKLESCLRALDGVPLAHIVDGRTPHSLLLELFTEAGIGTMVTR